MNKAVGMISNILAIIGVVLIIWTGIYRLIGGFFLFGFEASTLFGAGIAVMLMACLGKLHLLTSQA